MRKEANEINVLHSKNSPNFKYDNAVDYENEKTVSIGSRNACKWCQGKKWKDETSSMCCRGGKVELLQCNSLLTNQHPESENFLNNMRCFQMTLSGINTVKEDNFMPTLKV